MEACQFSGPELYLEGKKHGRNRDQVNLNRLLTVSEMIIPGEPVADIGSDHGLLPLYLTSRGLVPAAIATDLHTGPFERMSQAVEQSPGGEKITVRLGDGLTVIENSEVSTIIMAGMGGDTMVSILSYDWPKSCSFKRYIFQPMSRAGVLRRTLGEQGWPIMEETVVQEAHRFYPVICSRPGGVPYLLSPLEIDLGPIILHSKDKAVSNYQKYWLQKYRLLHTNLCASKAVSPERVAEVHLKISELEGILHAGES